MYRLLGRFDCLVLERILYDVFLCAYNTGFMMSESANFVGGFCDGTNTLGTDAVSYTTLVYGAGRVATTVDCGFNSDDNVG